MVLKMPIVEQDRGDITWLINVYGILEEKTV